jgi:hypothetical protein
MNPDMDAVYILSPQPHIVDCLMADFERRRYKQAYLVWIALLDPQMRRRIDASRQAQEQLAGFETLSIDYFPRESHLITFRDPWSFPILYHPACNNLVRDHMQILAQKVGWLRPQFGTATDGLCCRLLESVSLWENIPKCDIIDLGILYTKQASSVLTSHDLYKKNWTPMPNTTRISPHLPLALKAFC